MKNALFVLMSLFGIMGIISPYILAGFNVKVGGLSSTILSIFGVALLLVTGFIALIFNVYQKTKANEAFVKTGMGGRKVILDGGALVIPIFHEVIRIPLETLKLQVDRVGESALVTMDKLRADVVAEFFVRVAPDEASVIKASQSMGDKMCTPELVRELVDDKLTSALRSVAAKRTLEQLHTERDDFVQQVLEAVNDDLAHNGLTLEAVTISKLDQTDVRFLSDTNIFDAKGRQTIAEITEAAKTARNQMEREGERARKAQDVDTVKHILTLSQDEETAKARQEAIITSERAASARESKEKEIEAQRSVEMAELKKTREIELENIANQEAAQVATVKQQQQIQLASEAQKREVQLATEQREQSVTEAQKVKAAEEALLQQALASRQKAIEDVETVKVKAAAEREKETSIIAAQAKAESAYVAQAKTADGSAYQVKADADARKAAADADAEAKIKAANADKTAELAKVDAQRARELVPVEVEKGRVQVEKERVAVDRDRLENITVPELKAREEHGKVAQEFELNQLHIKQEALVKIEYAKATAQIMGKIEMNAFGTPEDVQRMSAAFLNGEGLNSALRGMGSKLTGSDIIDGVAAAAGKVVTKLTEDEPKAPPAE